MNRKNTIFVFLSFLMASIVLRFHTFSLTVIDWDETIHLMISMSLLEGHAPYLEMWDHKPPGLHLLFALGLTIFRDPIFTIRILTCIAVSITSLGLFKIVIQLNKNSFPTAIMAGLLFTVFSLSNGGLAANAELFFTPLVIFALYFLLGIKQIPTRLGEAGTLRLLLIGLLLGLAFQIKFLVAFDICAFVVALLVLLLKRRETQIVRKWTLGVSLIVIFPIIFLVGVGCYYFFIGHFDDFYFANFKSNQIYGASYAFNPINMVRAFTEQIGGHYFVWIGAFSALFLLFKNRKSTSDGESTCVLILGLWILIDMPGICLTKQYWSHYFLQLYPALCLLTALLVAKLLKPAFKTSRLLGTMLAILLFIGPLRHETLRHIKASARSAKAIATSGELFSEDTPTKVARYIAARTNEQDYIFMVDLMPVVYVLSSTQIPTKYAYPPFIIGKESSVIAGIDPLLELQAIMAKEPVFLAKKHHRPDPEGTVDALYNQVDKHLKESYRFVKSFGSLDLFERIND